MKKSILMFVAVIIVVVIAVVTNNLEKNGFSLAGGPTGKSLKELNDSAKANRARTNVIAFAQANTTTEDGNLFQVMTIGNWENQLGNGMYVGADVVGTISSQFGIMCPTYDCRFGFDCGAWRAEYKVGNFTRNSVTTGGFDPQFSNFCVLAGESAPVANAMQLTFICNGTKLYAGHQAGSKFYNLDGNYYLGCEQKIGNVSLSGGADLAHTVTGYADVKWSWHDNTITVTGNNLGAETQNFVLSYVHSNIPVFKGVKMNVGSAFWMQPEKKGLQLVTGLNKGKFTLFAQTGGYVESKIFTPIGGLGFNYNM
jgi:hypothetical protein